MHLVFGDASWLEPGGYPLPIQTSRILLYAGYFFTGVGIGAVSLRAGLLAENGELARRWPIWLGFALLFYGAILLLVYAHHNWIADFNSPPLSWRAGYGLAFAMFSAAMTFTVLAISLRFAKSSLRPARRDAALGLRHLPRCTTSSSSGCNTSSTTTSLPGRRQGCDRVRRHAVAELGAYGDCCGRFRWWRG